MKIVINHLTRFHSGYLCMAGVDVAMQRHVRPLPFRAHLRPSLLASEGGPLHIGAILELGPARNAAQAPQIEDVTFDLAPMQCLGTLAAPRFWNMLSLLARPSLAELFGPDLHRVGEKACAVDLGKGQASLGCLAPIKPPELYVKPRLGQASQVRIRLNDGTWDLDLGVTDIRLYGPDRAEPDLGAVKSASERLASEEAILCVGLTRPFTPSPGTPPMHWLQVNNLHFRA